MPFVHLTIRDWDKTRSARVLAALFLCFMLIGAAHHKYHFMYHEFDRDVLSATYTWPKLAGVRSTPGRVESTERLLNLIERNSDKGDYIFLYPDYSSAYYLTGRRNPTGIDWYYLLGGVPEIVDATLKRMEQNRPRVIVIDGPCHNVYLNTLVSRHYQVLDTIDQMIVYHLPSDSVAAP